MHTTVKKIISVLAVFSAAASITAAAAFASGTSETAAALPEQTGSRIITDMAGRTVEVPGSIDKIFCKGPMATIMLYTLAPERLPGWNYSFTDNEAQYIKEEYRNLPVLGGWFGRKNTVNMEELIALEPDIILDMDFINETTIEANDNIQQQTGIPVVFIDGGGFDSFADVYMFTGNLIGETERAEELASYCRNTLDDVRTLAATIPEEDRLRVYYAEGPEGLQTEAAGSRSTELVRLAGALDAAAVAGDENSFKINVSLEQVILWNPDVIVTAAESNDDSPAFYNSVRSNPDWMVIKAVKNNRVYGIPQNPFGWFDRPPSVNRIIGIKWLAGTLYPGVYNYNIREEVKQFYSLFYHIELTDMDVDRILNLDFGS